MSKPPKDPGPFLRYKFIPDKHIERAALAALMETRLLPASPSKVDIEKFCDRRWGFPEDYRDLGGGILGRATFNHGGLVSIEIDAGLEEDRTRVGRCRLRSTLAHEIAHGVMHADMFIEKIVYDQNQMSLFEEIERRPVAEKRIATRAGIVDVPRPFEWWEYQANRFMAEILMPKPLFLAVVGDRMDAQRVAAPGFSERLALLVERDIADTFEVSHQMARIAVDRHLERMRKTGEGALTLL